MGITDCDTELECLQYILVEVDQLNTKAGGNEWLETAGNVATVKALLVFFAVVLVVAIAAGVGAGWALMRQRQSGRMHRFSESHQSQELPIWNP